VYDDSVHSVVKAVKDKKKPLDLIFQGMHIYLRKKPDGKKFHDPLAAAVFIDPSICQFKEVILYSEKGKWGSVEAEGSNIFIAIQADHKKFVEVLCCQ
jgi:hypothetical protein